MSRKTLLNSKDIEIILHRLACQLIENHNDFSDTSAPGYDHIYLLIFFKGSLKLNCYIKISNNTLQLIILTNNLVMN